MNIKQAKQEIINTVQAYLTKDETGEYAIPVERQRPVLLIGPPGIGKTAIMEQVAQECGINLVSYTITHHTRQSAIGLPFISKKTYDGEDVSVTEYTMSEIIASIYDQIEQSGIHEGILFLDEINCVSETLAPTMLQFLQFKTFGNHRVPDGFVIVTAGNPPEYNKSVRDFDIVTYDRVKRIYIEEDFSDGALTVQVLMADGTKQEITKYEITGYNEKLYKDVLTGVYNRLYFEEEIKMWTGNAGIVVIDVDDFKLCNDTYGHLTGDMALAAVAGVIWRCIRREDTLVRYGGDEFVLVLPEIKEDGLVEKLQEIQEKIQNAVIPGYSNIQLSVSMGAVISQNESVEHAMLRARKLMYQAKNKKNMAITENNMIDHEGKIHAQKQPEKMIPEILVVDDEEVNRTLLDMIFSKDYHVLQAESGEKCIEILEQQVNSISLVLLDVVLPKMDGFDVLTYMNKNHWIEDIPVIMMSGADAPEAVKRAYALGAVDFVSKPCDAQIVYQRVTNTMKLYAKQRRLTSLITAQINEKEKNSEMLIHILSHIVEFRNGESGSHVLHIHKLTEMLLERLAQKTEKYHLDGDTRAMIALASSLHDIGKIGVDEKILNKPGKLTKEEFEIMKTHTVIGAEMLEQLGIYQDEPLVKIAHQICRWHHERYDGKGYPDGLVGDEIPISAQVVSVADVYDALASERVYKKAVPHEKVLEMILHGECGQFNPILIECLQEISSRIRSECYDEEQET